MPSVDDDWSDSDDELLSEVESSVLLGIPDGAVESPSDIKDAAVSRIGGHPVRLIFYPTMYPFRLIHTCRRSQALLSNDNPFDSSHCKRCREPMELLVQMWCPFEDSPYDRALYVWGCAKSACQRREGSVRAWRGLRYNEKFAAKLQRKRTRTASKQENIALPAPPSRSNPFAVRGMNVAVTPSPFGLGSEVFGGLAPPTTAVPAEIEVSTLASDSNDGADDSDAESDSSTSSMIIALASTTLSDSDWEKAPSYPPLYLSTASEYLQPQKKPKAPTAEDIVSEEEQRAGEPWAAEQYENSLETDPVFDRFNERVSAEAEQCVRYELGGAPLPFALDRVYKELFPLSQDPDKATVITKSEFKVQPVARRTYDPTSVPPCPLCGTRRVFECQLMPNLINVLKDRAGEEGGDQKISDEERRKAVQRLLKGEGDGRGMEWGTVMIFSCEKDCCEGKGEARKSGWSEEEVRVQWDS
ncbi:programmed cell death protein 2 [Amylostereum chailletii]|nr:programmed cell death protein 2 [Amylostereum chailletii]